jgi:NAD(P)-dependent dehydrogenase (short-subunit alcohol dehydrogenase family)
MQEFKDAVAVVTGGASGIGLALGERFARDGAKVVLADIERGALDAAVDKLKSSGADVIGVVCDVSKLESVQALRDAALERFGKVNILCNNAGVQVAGPTWQMTPGQWDWILGVNLKGVIHGVHVFVPQMLEQGDECHVVNTSSMSGLLSVPMMSAYQVTKHGVVTLSESLSQELAQQKAKIGVSVLCPAFVQTNLHEAERNRPAETRDQGGLSAALDEALKSSVKQLVTTGKPASEIADAVATAIREGELYVLTHPEVMGAFKHRADAILAAAKR